MTISLPFFLALAAVAGGGACWILFPRIRERYWRFRGARIVKCPDTGNLAEAEVYASLAALTGAWWRPLRRVKSCSLWPAWKRCTRRCGRENWPRA
ncbi:MAG TPA: hypothetical protein VNN77_09685 [candidate division Zixibacteria bacterium]|nr:hypothetical protein [candidate division Zixibacteria bacterium]